MHSGIITADILYIWISYIQNIKKLQSPGDFNIQETPGYKQNENVEK